MTRLRTAVMAALGIAMFITVCAGCFNYAPRQSLADYQCEDLIPQVIKLSKDNAKDNPFARPILKIYEPTETGRTTARLDCEADAKWNFDRVAFFIEEDSDGDRFIGLSPVVDFEKILRELTP